MKVINSLRSRSWTNLNRNICNYLKKPIGSIASYKSALKFLEEENSRASDFTINANIGVGGFASVYSALDRRTGKACAVKINHLDVADTVKCRELAALLSVTNIDNMIQVKTAYKDDGSLHIVLPLYSDGDLFDHIITNEQLKENEVKLVIRQVLCTIRDMHDRGLVHLDLKPENLFITKNSIGEVENVVVGDLGHARRHSGKALGIFPRMSPGHGSNYSAPEMTLENRFHYKSDVFSVGVIMHAMLHGYLPIDNGLSKYGDGCAVDLLELMLHRDIGKRVDADQALNHQWFQL